MASPENNIKWAESAAAVDLSFPAIEQDTGYAVGEDFPNSQKNQYDRDAARWVASGFESLGDFIALADPGQIGVVNSFDPTLSFGAIIEARPADQAICHAIDTDGRFVFTFEGDPGAPARVVNAYDRDDLTTIVATFTPQNGNLDNNEYVELVCNGSHVAIAINDSSNPNPVTGHVELYSWNPATLTFVHEWTWTDTAAVVPLRDIAIDDERVYIASITSPSDGNSGWAVEFTAGTGGAPITNGAEDWSSAHAANLSAVDSNGFYVAFGGETDGGITWRVTNFQGAAIDSGGAGVNDEIDERQIVVKSDRWYRVKNNAGTHEYWVRGFFAGLQVEERQLTVVSAAPPTVNLSVDSKYLLTGVDTGELSIVDLRTEVIFFRVAPMTTAHGTATDGDGFLFCGAAAGAQIQRRNRATGPRTWRRVAATDKNMPSRQLAISEES